MSLPDDHQQPYEPDIYTTAPPQYVKEIVLEFLRELFRTSKRFTYDDDILKTGIAICSDTQVDFETTNRKPALSVVLSGMRWQTLGLDDKSKLDLRNNTTEYSVLVNSALTINCISSNDTEAYNLGWVVAEHLWLFRKILMRNGRLFDIGRVIDVAAPTSAENVVANDAGKGWYVCAVATPLSLSRNSIVSPLGEERLRSFELTLQNKFRLVDESQLPVEVTDPPPFAPAQNVYGGYATPYSGPPQQLPIIPPDNPARTAAQQGLTGFSPQTRVKRTSL